MQNHSEFPLGEFGVIESKTELNKRPSSDSRRSRAESPKVQEQQPQGNSPFKNLAGGNELLQEGREYLDLLTGV